MYELKTTILPTKEDILSSIISGTINFTFKQGTFVNGLVSQLGSNVIAKNIALNTGIEDTSETAIIKEHDFYTTFLRGGYSSYTNKSLKTVSIDATKGATSNIMSRIFLNLFDKIKATPTPEPDEVASIIANDIQYNLKEGDYDFTKLTELGISFETDLFGNLSEGYKITGYKNEDFTGDSFTMTYGEGGPYENPFTKVLYPGLWINLWWEGRTHGNQTKSIKVSKI